MSRPQQRLNRLFSAAQKARKVPAPPEPATPPLGFAAGVAARWVANRRSIRPADAWERACWWGAAAAVSICLVAAVQQRPSAAPTAFEMLLETPEETQVPLEL
jgi:hypothetical protein